MGRRFREERDPGRARTHLGAALAQLCAVSGVPGASAAVWHDGDEWSAHHGVQDARPGGVAVGPGSVFALSSITKVVTACAVLRLVDGGRLQLTDRVVDLLPSFSLAGDASAITVEHLLTHTGGFEGPDGATAGHAGTSVDAFVGALGTFVAYAPPGRIYGYSSAGYIVLGAIVELVTSLPFMDALHELVIAPARMGMATVDTFDRARLAVGHYVEGAEVQSTPVVLYPAALDPAGGLWGTTGDLVLLARLFLDAGRARDGSALLRADTAAAAAAPLVARPEGADETLAQGLAWRRVTWDGEDLLWHTGGSSGHASKLTA
jgi:CubicO group peptidase (beta-lactamase class C family)